MVVFPPCISAENRALHDSTSAILQKQQWSLVVRETIPRRFQWSSSQMLEYDFTTVSYSDKKKIYVQSAMLSWKSHKASDTWSCKATKWDYIEIHSCTCFVLIKYKCQQQQEAGRRRK